MEYDSSKSEKQMAVKEREAFIKILDTINDDVFIEICESFDEGLLPELQKMINSDNLESVKDAILKFKYAAKLILKNKINLYNECLHKLDK